MARQPKDVVASSNSNSLRSYQLTSSCVEAYIVVTCLSEAYECSTVNNVCSNISTLNILDTCRITYCDYLECAAIATE